jgi:hypothetical protein
VRSPKRGVPVFTGSKRFVLACKEIRAKECGPDDMHETFRIGAIA